jgi:dihydrofolate reductase
MSTVTSHMSISLDGYVAGPDQSLDHPLGKGGMRLHQWHLGDGHHPADVDVADRILAGVGAFIMGRKMFGGARDDGSWVQGWEGWWGDDPPYHAPVFVLTHHPRDPIEMQGGTTFTFVTDGIESALEQARAAAGGQNVDIAGGASAVQQYLRAGVIDELTLNIIPVLLGDGERLLQDVGDPRLELVEVLASPIATHVKYRVVH